MTDVSTAIALKCSGDADSVVSSEAEHDRPTEYGIVDGIINIRHRESCRSVRALH